MIQYETDSDTPTAYGGVDHLRALLPVLSRYIILRLLKIILEEHNEYMREND